MEMYILLPLFFIFSNQILVHDMTGLLLHTYNNVVVVHVQSRKGDHDSIPLQYYVAGQ